MRPRVEQWYERAMRVAPATVSSRVDSARLSLRHSWGGPLNGQEGRQRIVRELARAIHFDRVYETGTYRGTTTEFLLAVFECPVFSVEISERFFRYSRARLSYSRRVHLERGDSRSFLQRHATVSETAFIYLDAHWQRDLPLCDELRIISSGWPRAVVMIDDFRVPDDDGYGFDDYGPGKVLEVEILPKAEMDGWQIFYPVLPSAQETGAGRGCCVLASGPMVKAARVASLRPGYL